jgi:NAD(P)-dependent dehydrogenase (short-subunit alcohol dehydrogenase family)
MKMLSAQSAIVTGAGRGFGKAIALALADAGAAVTLTSRTHAELTTVAATIRQRGGRAESVTGDVCELNSVRDVCEAHRSRFGPATILVNCAGAAEPFGPIGQIDVGRWWQTMTVNVLGPLNYMSVALPQMQAAGRRGCIINVASVAAQFVIGNNSSYSVSKSALVRLSEHVAKETTGSGIAVFAVHPGAVYTALSQTVVESEEARRWIPQLVTLFEGLRDQDASEGLARCGAHCVTLAIGAYDHLSGQFLQLDQPEITPPVHS